MDNSETAYRSSGTFRSLKHPNKNVLIDEKYKQRPATRKQTRTRLRKDKYNDHLFSSPLIFKTNTSLEKLENSSPVQSFVNLGSQESGGKKVRVRSAVIEKQNIGKVRRRIRKKVAKVDKETPVNRNQSRKYGDKL